MFLKTIESLYSKLKTLYVFKMLEIEYLVGLNFNTYREKELFLINYFIKSKSNIIDVGANVGDYTYIFLKRSPENIFCFEPIPHLNSRLIKLFKNIQVSKFALSNKRAKKIIKTPINKGKNLFSRSSLNVEILKDENCIETEINTIPLDAWMDEQKVEKIDLIKIDVEGHELELLQGASKTIKNSKPIILIEIENRHSRNKGQVTIDFILSYGYKAFYVNEKNEFINFHKFDFISHQKVENLKTKKYINNFLFIDIEDSETLGKVKKNETH